MAICNLKGDLRKITYSHIDSISELIKKEESRGKNLDLPDKIRVQKDGDTLFFLQEGGNLREIPVNMRSRHIEFEYLFEKTEKNIVYIVIGHV